MKIILMSVGTRGDMEPFLAIGEMLKEEGHRVIIALPEQFSDLVEGTGMGYASLGRRFIEMLESDEGKAALGGSSSGFRKFLAMMKLAMKQTDINKELVSRQHELVEKENPERIVYNGKAIYPVIWEMKHPGKTVFVSPVPYIHYVKGHTHVAFNSNFGSFLNKLTFRLADLGMIMTTRISMKWLGISAGYGRKQIKNAFSSRRAVYTISPTLFPRPDHWDDKISILGYHDRNKSASWSPEGELQGFIEKHERILFITFGSMTNPEPEQKTRIFVDILERHRIPAIINTAGGGLARLSEYDPGLIHFVSRIPYDRIFPRIHAVIHHGGSGTTHLALNHACATMIIPHIIDQFVWSKKIYQMGAGPRGIKAARISRKNLEPKILDLMNRTSFREKAEQLATLMAREDFRDEIIDAVTGTGTPATGN